MRLKAFAIFDDKAKAFLPPFFLPERAIAVRTFADCVNNKEHAFGRHPADYSLFQVGDFDTDSGLISPVERGIELIHNGLALLNVEKDERQLALVKTGG